MGTEGEPRPQTEVKKFTFLLMHFFKTLATPSSLLVYMHAVGIGRMSWYKSSVATDRVCYSRVWPCTLDKPILSMVGRVALNKYSYM